MSYSGGLVSASRRKMVQNPSQRPKISNRWKSNWGQVAESFLSTTEYWLGHTFGDTHQGIQN